MTPEELEAQRLAEEAEAQRLAQEAASTNPIMQPTDLIGQQGQQETGMDTNPLLMGGVAQAGLTPEERARIEDSTCADKC